MKFILTVLLILISPIYAVAEMTVADYEKVFAERSLFTKAKASESLAWAGLSNNEFFDSIEADLLANYMKRKNEVNLDHLAWLVKALGFSGNEKYRPTLVTIQSDAKAKKLRKYAKVALADLPEYTVKNKLIYPDQSQPYPSLQQRYLNMIESDNFGLMTIAAKRIQYKRHFDEVSLDALAKAIKKYYKTATNRQEVTAVAYMVKALVISAEDEYHVLVEEVSTEASSAKLRKYAKGYIAKYMR